MRGGRLDPALHELTALKLRWRLLHEVAPVSVRWTITTIWRKTNLSTVVYNFSPTAVFCCVLMLMEEDVLVDINVG